MCMESKTRIPETLLKKKNEVEGINLPNFKTHCTATVKHTSEYWQRDRNIGQWIRIWIS